MAMVLVLASSSGAAGATAATVPRPGSDSLIPARVVREDFEFLYATLQAAHYNLFARTSRERYDREYARVLRSIDRPMRRLDAIRLFTPFVGYGDIAHAHLDFPFPELTAYGQAGGTLLPLELRMEDGRGFVTRNESGIAGVDPGTEILSIDGRPIAEWADSLGRYVAADTPYLRSALMESFGAARLAWLDQGQADSFRVEIRTPAGAAAIAVPARSARALAEQARARGAGTSDREVRILPSGIAYLKPGPFYDTYAAVTQGEFDPRNFRAFVDSAFRQILASEAADLIIDLRGNPGGDNSFSDVMIAWFATRPFAFCSTYSLKASAVTRAYYRDIASRDLPKSDADAVAQLNAALASRQDGERFPLDIPLVQPKVGPRYTGRVYVFVDRFSYSMATSVAAQIQDYRFGWVIGEETADLPTSYGSVARFTLPGTGIQVSYPKGYLVRPSGDTTTRGVVPDVPIPLPLVRSAGDPGLDRAVAMVLSRRPR